jgi:hypothetical protein
MPLPLCTSYYNITAMNKVSRFTKLILVISIALSNCSKEYKEVTGILTRNNGNDTILNCFSIENGTILDLKLCVDKFEYPPFIPEDFFWKIPDTSGYSNKEKDNLFFKYNFDTSGKVTMYYYVGSYVSDICALPYYFIYDRDKPELVYEITDWSCKTKYSIKYDDLLNVQSIEKLDSINERIEVLKIVIK